MKQEPGPKQTASAWQGSGLARDRAGAAELAVNTPLGPRGGHGLERLLRRGLCPGLAKAEQCQDGEVSGVRKTHGPWGQAVLGSNPASANIVKCVAWSIKCMASL